jgi:hypothetical protein
MMLISTDKRVANMNRFTTGIPVALVLSAASLAALADDAPSTAAPVAATAAATSTPPASTPAKVEQPGATSSANSSVRRLVCLNMALHCFAIKPQAEDASAKAKSASLDLKAPDIRRVASPIMLNAPTDEPVDIEEQQVQVQGTRPEVYVPGGLASLPWAVMNPTQAWRIFLPVPAGQAK